MIETFKATQKNYADLLHFLVNNFDYDFYFTEHNARYYIDEIPTLKKLLKSSDLIYSIQTGGDFDGIILTWKSVGGGKQRHYVKLNVKTVELAEKLLTVLLWNTKQHLFVKLRKDSKFMPLFKNKGFRFKGGRGIQVLLQRKYQKEEKNGS